VHYVQWLDVMINVQGRPVIFGPKMLVIFLMASLVTWIAMDDVSGSHVPGLAWVCLCAWGVDEGGRMDGCGVGVGVDRS
jgi:hypothetical protein